MALYMTDAPNARIAFELASLERGSSVVLIQDGVRFATQLPLEVLTANLQVYAVEPDVARRGIGARLDPKVQLVGYRELIDLIVGNPVVNLV